MSEKENLDDDRSDDENRALIWLHRTEIGERYVCHQVHPQLSPLKCPDCTLFIEAPNGGKR